MKNLSTNELVSLVNTVFPRSASDRRAAFLVDMPLDANQDQPDWRRRREMAREWFGQLKSVIGKTGLKAVELYAYENVGSNNADLPARVLRVSGKLPASCGDMNQAGQWMLIEQMYRDCQIFFALTEYSATAPLKVAARKYGFRAATMPGFTEAMIPALRLDYEEINNRCLLLEEILNQAESVSVVFRVDQTKLHSINFDLRFRIAHVSSGRFADVGTAGNLPSGETYIVPYEGEMDERSESEGLLPVQIKNEIVLYRVKENRAINVESSGEQSRREAELVKNEPAYANIAELGFGVLADFGIEPVGQILLDEKLGFHIAFGRSDHFGGIVAPGDFSSPDKVVHLDRVFIPQAQPRIRIDSVTAHFDNSQQVIMKDGAYAVF
jgi:leucyl aminopeptidase (aminopeptidase T)